MRDRRLLAFGAATFAVLGMPKAAFGVAWPSIAADLGRPVADLGVALVVFLATVFVAGLLSGEATRRFGAGATLSGAIALGAAALVGYAWAPGWGWLLLAAAVLGLAEGFIDAGINTQVALREGTSAMGWLHAAFGIGSTIGPLIMTAVVQSSRTSWRAGFGVLAVVQVILLLWSLRRIDLLGARPPRRPPAAGRPADRRVVLGVLAVFFLYTGLEVGAGQWAYTWFTEGRGIGEGAAGLLVAGYWGLLTVSRLMLGWVGDRVAPPRLLSASTIAAVGGVLLMWWNPVAWIGPTGLLLTGLALGPVFPLHMLLTPRRVGAAATPAAVGYQVAAANLGAAALPGLTGLAVGVAGLGVVGPFLASGALGLAVAGGVLNRLSLPGLEHRGGRASGL